MLLAAWTQPIPDLYEKHAQQVQTSHFGHRAILFTTNTHNSQSDAWKFKNHWQ